jgi:8-oxo-dGTP pyrophosphatase MutT (NUDIX family)
MNKVRTITTARGIIWHEEKLLLVSHNKNTWYAPGGWLDGFESLPTTCKREIFEELGCEVEVGPLVKVCHYAEPKEENSYGENINKVEHYFLCTLKTMPQIEGENNLWEDHDNGLVKFAKWFTKEELFYTKNIGPAWLKRTDDTKFLANVFEAEQG